eukprot:4886334-Pleurochrysis_carterae.AAC.1
MVGSIARIVARACLSVRPLYVVPPAARQKEFKAASVGLFLPRLPHPIGARAGRRSDLLCCASLLTAHPTTVLDPRLQVPPAPYSRKQSQAADAS